MKANEVRCTTIHRKRSILLWSEVTCPRLWPNRENVHVVPAWEHRSTFLVTCQRGHGVIRNLCKGFLSPAEAQVRNKGSKIPLKWSQCFEKAYRINSTKGQSVDVTGLKRQLGLPPGSTCMSFRAIERPGDEPCKFYFLEWGGESVVPREEWFQDEWCCMRCRFVELLLSDRRRGPMLPHRETIQISGSTRGH